LRVYIEEAAGISRYKERRKETETRLSNTRDNLARLYDIREELTRQLSHLQKQADAAEKYRTLKTEERQTKIELLVRVGKRISSKFLR
jgi:chromosome segregation protein